MSQILINTTLVSVLSEMLGSCTRTSKWHLHGFRRSLFNLPDLTSMSPFGAQPITQKYHKILPCVGHLSEFVSSCLSIRPLQSSRYSQRQTYDVVADVASYSGFVPFCIGSRILSSLTPEPDSSRKLTMNAELIIEFLSYKKGYISKVTCVPGESVEASLFILSCLWLD